MTGGKPRFPSFHPLSADSCTLVRRGLLEDILAVMERRQGYAQDRFIAGPHRQTAIQIKTPTVIFKEFSIDLMGKFLDYERKVPGVNPPVRRT